MKYKDFTANEHIDRAIAMLKEQELNTAGYNGVVCLLGYAKEANRLLQEAYDKLNSENNY